MSGDCQSLLLRAMLARLKADVPLSAEVGARIYETVPGDAVLPCVALNDVRQLAFDTDTSDGALYEIDYSIFARGEAARVDVRRIGALVAACLNRSGQFLSVAGHKVVLVRFTRSIVFRTDAQTNGEAHGVYSFEALTEALAAASGY